MAWQSLATIQIGQDWKLTESVTGTLFRITHNVSGTNIQSLRSVIAQAFDENGNTTYFDIRRLTYKSESEAYLFQQPGGLLNRKLAIKRLDSLLDNWSIKIEVLDGMPESISLPISINEVSGLQKQLDTKAELPLAIDDVATLPQILSAKAPAIHTHLIDDISALGNVLLSKADTTDPRLSDARSPMPHGHVIANVANLQATLDSKVATNDPRLSDARVPLAHPHGVTDITNLQTTLNNKVDTNDTRLSNARAPLAHTHGVTDITNLQTTLNNKVDISDSRLTNARIPLGFVNLLAVNGFQKFYGGLIEQWGVLNTGVFAYTANTQAVFNINWAIAFNTIFNARLTLVFGLYSSSQTIVLQNRSNTGAVVYFMANVSGNLQLVLDYSAIGI